MHAPGPGWASEDNLSPQDVILNYFDYQPGSGKGRGTISDHGDAGYNGDTSAFLASLMTTLRLSIGRNGQARLPRSPHMMNFSPIAAGHAAPPKAADASERESSRLLGAAAIGLVGGIAIAASLAVFVINSYGPGGRAWRPARRTRHRIPARPDMGDGSRTAQIWMRQKLPRVHPSRRRRP